MMNEELDGLVSLGIERGRDFLYISNILKEEGYSEADIKSAEQFYNQKKKSQSDSTSASKPAMDSGASGLGGPRGGKSGLVSGFSEAFKEVQGQQVAVPQASVVANEREALGAIQFGLTGKAPLSYQQEKILVADKEKISAEFEAQKSQSAKIFLANKEAGNDPYQDPEFQAAKQKENEFVERGANVNRQLHPELPEDVFVAYNDRGEARETPLSETKYLQSAIKVIPGLQQDIDFARIQERKQAEDAVEAEEFRKSYEFGNIPVISKAANLGIAVASGLTDMVESVAAFITEPFAGTTDEYEGIIPEVAQYIYESAKSTSAMMRQQRGVNLENYGLTASQQEKDPFSLWAEGDIEGGSKSLAVMVADAALFSRAIGALYGVGGTAARTQVGQAILATGKGGAQGVVNNLSRNVVTNVADSPVMFGAMATLSAQQSWDAVKERDDLTLSEKLFYQSVGIAANTLTEALNVDDLRLVTKGLPSAQREIALKSFRGTVKSYFEDVAKVGAPEAFEETLNFYAEAFAKYVIDGELPTITDPLSSIAVGFLAPSLNVTATYAPAMIETALATTPWKMAKTKEFERNRKLAEERGRIVEALANENLPQNEKKILQKALNNIEAAIEDQERKDFEFYSGMEYADANEILNIHGQIGTKVQQYKKTRSKELRTVLEAEIRGLYGRKVEIENNYDGTQKSGISSSVFQGQATEQAKPEQGASQETIEASGVLQVSTEEGPEVTAEQETTRQEASKGASEEFVVGAVTPGRVITEGLARVMNNIFNATKAVVRGGKVQFHYSQESIANANETTRSKKAKNPKIFFDGFYDRTNKVFHVYIPTAADSAKVVKQEDGKYALVDPKFAGQVIKTYDDRTTAFQAKQRYDENYIKFATSKARHEAIHPVIDALILEDKPILDKDGNQVVNNVGEKQFIPNSFRQFLYDNIVSLYSSSPDAQRIFDSFLDPYIQSGATSATMQREAITEFLAAMADEKKFKQLDRGFIQKVKDIVNELLVRAGIRDISISTDDDLYTVARAFKTAMALGVEVKVQKGGWKSYTPVGEVFSVDMLDGLKASGFTDKRLRGIITAGKFGMLTGQNPRGTKFPEEVREKFNREAEAWLKSRGYEAIPILGKFEGIAENSFLVPNLTADDALLFAREFNQEAVAHNSGFIHFDGSFEPRIPDNNVFGVKYEDKDNDNFSALRTKDGKLTAFKVDYNWDVRLNYRALEDGLTNQIDFSISIPEGQTYAEFFDSIGDQSMRAQATMLQLLAEKVGYSKPILFSTKGTTSFDATKDYTIFNVAEDRELNESFGYFANALSTIISKENMGLYRSLLDETKRNFPELVESKFKEAEKKFGDKFLTDRKASDELYASGDSFIERLAIKAALDEKMVEFFKTNETDFEALRKNWETSKKLIGEAINVDITDIVPNMKIDGVMEILASPTRDIYAATEVATRLKRTALGGGESLTVDEARVSIQELQNVAAVVGQDAVVGLNGFVASKDLVDGLALILVEVGKTKDGTSTFKFSESADSATKGDELRQRLRNIDYDELYDLARGFWIGASMSNPEFVREYQNSNFDAEIEKLKSFLEETVNNLKDVAANTLRGSNIRKALEVIDEYNSRILTEIESSLGRAFNPFSSYEILYNSYNDIAYDAKDFFAEEFNKRINDPRRLMNMSIRGAIIEISELDTFTIEDAKAYIASELSNSANNFGKMNTSDAVYADIDGYSVGGAMYTLSPDANYYRLRDFIGNDNLSSVVSDYGPFSLRIGDIIGEANSAISRRTAEASKTTRYKLPEADDITSARIEVFIPKLNDTYVVTGTYYDGDVGVAFSSTTTGYDLKDPGAALSVMPEVIKAISRMFPERDVKSISFSPIDATSNKRQGGELRRGVYRMFAQRLFGNYFPVGLTSDDENVIPIPYVFRSAENTKPVYEDMANKQINRPRDIDFAISNFENIPQEVSQGLNTISNAVAFASQSSFANKLLFKDELQNRFKSYEKELKNKYGIKSFKVGGKSKAVDTGLKNYLVDAYVYETLVAIQAYPDALGWYDYKTRAAMAIMSLIHPELKTDPMAAVAFKIAVAVTSNGNKVFDNFKEADRQYEYFKKNGKFDSEKSIGTQSSGIKSTLKLVNNVLDRMTMEEFNSFLTSKFRAGDLKYVSKGKSKTLLSGFNVNTEVYGASIFGPKIGNGFFMNLNGQFDQLTMDRWFMRQYGRLTGTLIERDANKIASGKVRLKGAVTALSSKEKSILTKVIPGFAKMSLDERATAINKVSIVKEKRDMLSSTDALNELRKAGNNLAKNLSGEVEAPNGGTQRDFIIDVFNEAQKELNEKYGIDITIADLQAVNWYPEKALYQTFQDGRDEEDGSVETSDNEQPDYESAAVKLAQERGVTNQQIENARARTNSGERAAESNGLRAELIGGDSVKSSAEEIRRKILSVKAGQQEPVDLSISVQPPKFEIEGKTIRGFAERMADSNIQLYSDIIENPENYYTPQTLEEIQSQLVIMTIPELLDKMTTDKVTALSGSIKVDLTDEDNISVLLGAELIKRYSAEGDDVKLLEMIERMSKMGTTVGRMLRHFGEIKNATHIGIVQTVVAMAQRAGRRLTDTQITKLNTLAQELFALQVEGKDMMSEALRAPSTALDKAIKEKETQLKIATKRLDDFISTAVPKSAQDIFGGLIKGNLLTPVSQVVNVFANVANVFTRQFLVNPPAVLIDAVRAFAYGKPREITPSVAAFFFGVKRAAFVGIPEAVEYIFKGTRPTEETFQYESRQGFLPIQAMIAALSDTKVADAINKAAGKEVIKPDQLARLEDGSISFSDRLKKITEATFGIAPEVMFRLLTLGDRPFARFQEGIEIYRRGKKLGLRGGALDNFIKHPDPATIKAGREAGREITYQADTSFSTTVQKILNTIGNTKLGNFLVTIIVPYSKTPSNIIADTLNYVAPPVAIILAVRAAKKGRFDEFATLLGKSFVGGSLYVIADFLVKNGLATAGIGDDEKKEREMFYSLFPYNSINLSGLRRYINGEDTSLQSSDVFVDYSKAGPIGAIIGARAAYWANKETKPVSVAAEAENYGEIFTMYLSETIGTTMSSFQFMAQQSFLANTNQILELLTTKGDIEPDYILSSLFKTTSAAILPNTLTALNRATRAKLPDLYDKNSLYNSLTNVIKDRTFNTDDVPVKFNIWGEAVDQTPFGANPILYNLFDPAKYQKRQYRPEQLEVFRLYEELGQETKVIPTIPTQLMSRKFKDPETEIEYTFTNEEVNAMMEKLGKERSKAMAELIKEDWYKSYNDEDKAYELEYLYKDISKNGEWKQMLYNFMETAKQENRIKE
jgi:hypothetical protein